MSDSSNSKPRILVLEDEKNVALTLTERLGREGFQITLASTLTQARSCIRSDRFELALLDVGLPDGDGFSFAHELRKLDPSSAIIFLTAFGNPEDRVKGLEIGAEDYIVKPFHFKELVLRIRNAIKRAEALNISAKESQKIKLGKAWIDFEKFEAKAGDQVYFLTHKECAVLRLLVSKRGQVVSRDEILNQAWTEDEDPSPRTIDNFIVRLRKIIEERPDEPKTIRSIRGVGYQLMEEES